MSNPENGNPTIRRIVKGEDLRALYNQIRGVPYANYLIDAEEACLEERYLDAVQLIEDVRRRYEKSHLLERRGGGEPSDARSEKQTFREQERIQKCKLMLAEFDALVGILRRMELLEKKSRSYNVETDWSEPASDPTIPTGPEVSLPADFVSAYQDAKTPENEFKIIRQHFDAFKVRTEQDILPGSLYYLQSGGRTYLLVVSDSEPIDESVTIHDAFTSKQLKAISKQKFLEQGEKKRLIRLAEKS